MVNGVVVVDDTITETEDWDRKRIPLRFNPTEYQIKKANNYAEIAIPAYLEGSYQTHMKQLQRGLTIARTNLETAQKMLLIQDSPPSWPGARSWVSRSA